MQKKIRRELGKSRELLWHLLDGENCFFCHKPLLAVSAENIKFGNASAQPIDVAVTIHHKDGNHGNNAKSNRKLAHQSCHKAFHCIEILHNRKKVTPIRSIAA